MSEIDKFFTEPVERKQKILIFDFGNLFHRNFFQTQNEFKGNRLQYIAGEADKLFDEKSFYNYLTHRIYSSIFAAIIEKKPDRVIIACDGRNNWRKKVYPDYKANRKEKRDNDEVDWETVYKQQAKIIEDFKTNFSNVFVLTIDKCEADDIIGIIAEVLSKQNCIVELISNDKDFLQLQKYKNFKQYDPIQRKYLESIDPKRDLEIKILCGDRGDWIPNVKSNDMQHRERFGPVGASKVLDAGLEEFLSNEDYKKNYLRNRTLISFQYVPEDIKGKIIEFYSNYKINSINIGEIYTHFLMVNLSNLVEDWQKVAKHIKKLS